MELHIVEQDYAPGRKTGARRRSTYRSKTSVLIAPSIIIGAHTPRSPRAAIVDTFGPRLKGSTVSVRRPFGARDQEHATD